MAIFGDEQAFNGSYDDLQREKRLNNWQRSYQLPSMIGDAVQSAMLNNPYDRSAALRAELATQTANSVNLPWRTREALANELFKASPINATSGDGAAPGQRTIPLNPRTATQSAGPVAARGIVNGQELAVPTAGNYVNGAFSAEMNRIGAGDSPSWQGYQQANFDAQPAQVASRLNADRNASNERVAQTQAQGRVNAAAAKPQKGGKDDTMTQLRKLQGMDDKERVESTKELYGSYQKYVTAQQKAMEKPLSFEEWSKTDPGAQAIQSKWEAIGDASGRKQRESSAVQGGYDVAGQLAGVGIEAAGGLAQSPVDPQVHQALKQRVAEMKAANMTPQQILEHAKTHGVTGAELSIVQQEAEGEKIRRAQYGSPAKPKPKAKAKSTTPQRPMFEGNYQLKAGPPVDYNPQRPMFEGNYQLKAGPPVDYNQAEAAAPQQPSILDQLIQRIQSPQFMPVPRYSASGPLA